MVMGVILLIIAAIVGVACLAILIYLLWRIEKAWGDHD